MGKGVIIILLSLCVLIILNLISAEFSVGVEGEIGIDLIPEIPTNFSAVNVNNSQFLQGFTPTALGKLFDGTLNSTSWQRTGINVFLVNSGDRVGIGTDGPQAELHIDGGVVGNIISEGSVIGILMLKSSGATSLSQVYGLDSTEDKLHFRRWNDALGTIQNTIMTLDNEGNVGIGTTTPSEKLVVEGNILVKGGIFYADNTTGRVGIGTTSPAYTFEVGNQSETAVNLSGVLYVNADVENVGIGTTSPTAKLDVAGNISFTDLIYGNGSQLTDVGILDDTNSTQFDSGGDGDTLNILTSWLTTFWNVIWDTKTTDDLTEGSGNFYNNDTFDDRVRDVDCSGTDKVIGIYSNGTVKCGSVVTGIWTNVSGTATFEGDANITGDIYSNNYQVLSYQREIAGDNVTMTVVI